MAYLLDANVFIQAKNLHYGLDFCPAFWDWLIAGNAAKQVFSIEVGTVEIIDCVKKGRQDYEWRLAKPTRLKRSLKPKNYPQPAWFNPF